MDVGKVLRAGGTLRIRPRRSVLLAAFLLATHGAALAVVVALPLDWYWRAGLGAMVLANLIYTIRVHILFRAPSALREATWNPDGTWILTLVSGEHVEAWLLPSTFVSPDLIVLNFRYGRRRFCALLLPPDALDPDLRRRLRVRLRIQGAGDRSGTDVPV